MCSMSTARTTTGTGHIERSTSYHLTAGTQSRSMRLLTRIVATCSADSSTSTRLPEFANPTRYTSTRDSTSSARTMERVLDAAASLAAEDAFHTATMDDLARRASVAGPTGFPHFGPKLGVREALSLRCAGGPEMRALRAAQAVEDPVAALDALLTAGSDLWENEGYIMIQLKAIVVLEPDASAIIEAQYDDQRRG